MGEYFDDIHASYKTELYGLECDIPDSPETEDARVSANDYEGYIRLGKTLSRQLRYTEAAKAFSDALREKPDDPDALRLCAGRYLSILQTEKAYALFERCRVLGGETLDIRYRLGLCDYFEGNYVRAMEQFEECMPAADDEMGAAVIFWHTLCAYRSGEKAGLLSNYHRDMKVGHHFAYEKAVRVFAGACSEEDMMKELEEEREDLHYTITAYGLSVYLTQNEMNDEGSVLARQVIARDSFWPCYAFLAAWNDENRRWKDVQYRGISQILER